ncbi:MAG: hypothetical protein QOD54_156, partial [Sphingomonadales bacterium]|nr:hypothetical protein [Sphingomonadales bacterium]
MRTIHKLAIAVAAAALTGCGTAPAPQLASGNAPMQAFNEVPYHWTVGNAPQAHRDLVAEFGRVG